MARVQHGSSLSSAETLVADVQLVSVGECSLSVHVPHGTDTALSTWQSCLTVCSV